MLGLVGDSATTPILDNLEKVGPGPAQEIVTAGREHPASRARAGALLVVGLAVALWTASGYVAAFMRASNAIYDIPEGRPMWKTLPVRLGLTLVLLVLLVASARSRPWCSPAGWPSRWATWSAWATALSTVWDVAKWPVLMCSSVPVRAALLGRAQRQAARLPLGLARRHASRVLVWVAGVGRVRVLRLELRLVQQDLRRARRRDRLPRVAVDLEHRRAPGRRVQRRARTRAGGSRPGMPADQEPFMEPRDTSKMESERS